MNLVALVMVGFLGISAVVGVADAAGPVCAVVALAVVSAAIRWLIFHIEHREN
jgi:hypothetical protein